MADVIVVGCGPAGISAALYTARAGLGTLIVGKPGGALAKTEKIENYYGFAEPVSGRTLIENGLAQAKRVGAGFVEDEAVGLSWDEVFSVSTASAAVYRAPYVVLATGAQRRTPPIKGVSEFEGRGVSYCAVCDAFFYRKKNVAVLGAGSYALHEAETLLPVVASVTILTDGAEPAAEFPPEMKIEKRKIRELFGGKALEGVRFEDGTALKADGVFIAIGVAGSVDLARKIGAETNGSSITVGADRQTNVPGLYAAGDCTGGLLQISKSVCDGAVAGTSIVKAFHRRKP
jgi:thioredoxin reductase (NADPH)